MTKREVAERIREALALGVRELYFTGGEPFLHPDLLDILEDGLACAPCTVLTNGTLFTAARLERLCRLRDLARYSLELRVSLDGPDPASHDRFRGAGSFARTLEGLQAASRMGLLPIVTAVEADDLPDLRDRLLATLRGAGLERPRLKLLPLFRHGREGSRSRPYQEAENLEGLPAIEPGRLQCGSCRAVTSRGVFPCPLLVEEPGARMSDRLDGALGSVVLAHGACYTCYLTGMTCGNG